MQCDNNTKFLLAWLPVFAVDPPTEKECKAGQPMWIHDISCNLFFFGGSPNIQEVLAKVAQEQKMTISKDKEDITVTLLKNALKIENHFQTISNWHGCLGLVSDRRQLAQSIGFKSAKCSHKDRKHKARRQQLKWLWDWKEKQPTAV